MGGKRISSKKPIARNTSAQPKNNAFNQWNILSYWYQATDMEYIGNQLVHDLPCVKFVGPISKDSSKELVSHKAFLSKDKSLVGTYNTGENHWIAFIIIKDNTGKISALYKDSCGKEHKDFENSFKTAFDSKDFQCQSVNTTVEQILTFEDESSEGNGLVNCGIFALMNMQILAKNFNEHADLEKVLFFTPRKETGSKTYSKDIQQAREEFAILYARELYIKSLLQEICKQHEEEPKVLTQILNNSFTWEIQIEGTSNLEQIPNYYYCCKYTESEEVVKNILSTIYMKLVN